jgi:hypothetical protein
VELCIRPENIVVNRASATDAPNAFPASIVDYTATSSTVTVYCEVTVPAGLPIELEAILPAARFAGLRLETNRTCALIIPPDAVSILPSVDS